jgi:prolyl-tRNA editing enzyme YbaK/EbsC (Cys-tRNA(Pro) deacylase)
MEDIATRVLAAVREHRIEHEVLPCDPALADTAAFCAHYGVALEDSANAILVMGKGEPRKYAVCLLLATTRLDVNHAVCRAMGVRRASFAAAEETERVTGMMVGGVTPFGLPPDLPVLIDAAVLGREKVVIGGGSRSLKLLLPPAELLRLPDARAIEGLAQPRAAG